MCAVCTHALPGGAGCAITGAATARVLAHGYRCPKRLHPRMGLVRWRWFGMPIVWRGVPEPVRWELSRRGLLTRTELRGCGCIAAIERWWDHQAGTVDLGRVLRAIAASIWWWPGHPDR